MHYLPFSWRWCVCRSLYVLRASHGPVFGRRRDRIHSVLLCSLDKGGGCSTDVSDTRRVTVCGGDSKGHDTDSAGGFGTNVRATRKGLRREGRQGAKATAPPCSAPRWCARAPWLRDRAPRQAAMAVAMAHHCHGWCRGGTSHRFWYATPPPPPPPCPPGPLSCRVNGYWPHLDPPHNRPSQPPPPPHRPPLQCSPPPPGGLRPTSTGGGSRV